MSSLSFFFPVAFKYFLFRANTPPHTQRHCDLPNSLISIHLPCHCPSECYNEWLKGTRRRKWRTFQVWHGTWNLRTLHKLGRGGGLLHACWQHWASDPSARLHSTLPPSLSDLRHDPIVPQEGPWGPAGSNFPWSVERRSECSPIHFIFRHGGKDEQRGWDNDRHPLHPEHVIET